MAFFDTIAEFDSTLAFAQKEMHGIFSLLKTLPRAPRRESGGKDTGTYSHSSLVCYGIKNRNEGQQPQKVINNLLLLPF